MVDPFVIQQKTPLRKGASGLPAKDQFSKIDTNLRAWKIPILEASIR